MSAAASRGRSPASRRTSSRRRRSIRRRPTRLTPEQERFYLASQWMLMWWKFKRHRVAVVSGIILLLMYALDARHRVAGAVQPAHAAHRLHLRAAAERALVPRRPVRRAVRLSRSSRQLNMETLRRDYTEDTGAALSAALLLLAATPTSSGGCSTRRFHLVCPPEGATLFLLGTDRLGRDVLSRIFYGARISLTDRPARHHDQLHARPHLRRHRRLFRRLGRHGHPARDRDHPLVPRAAAVDGAVGGAAGDVEPDPRSTSASPASWRCSTGPGSRAPCARSCSRCARRTTAPRRG